jgi:hypothetical protein
MVGLGKPSAKHSRVKSLPAFARISLGSITQLGGTYHIIKYNLRIKLKN